MWSNAVDLLPPEWSVQWVKRYGRPVAFWAVKGNEIHCCRDPLYSGFWLTRQDIERLIVPLLERYGHLTTTVRSENQTGHAFVQRLGFVKKHEKDGLTHYRAERINHARL